MIALENSLPSDDTLALVPLGDAPATIARWRDENPAPALLARTVGSDAEPITVAIRREEDATLVGLVWLLHEAHRGTLDFAVWIAPAFRNDGLGSRTGALIIDHAFRSWQCHRVGMAHRMSDPAAARMAQKLQLLPEGVQRHAWRENGIGVDIAHYGLLQEDR